MSKREPMEPEEEGENKDKSSETQGIEIRSVIAPSLPCE